MAVVLLFKYVYCPFLPFSAFLTLYPHNFTLLVLSGNTFYVDTDTIVLQVDEIY